MEWTTRQDLGTLSGPVLLFGGAYSNLQALTALRAEAERLGIPPGNVICTGDTPGYCADPEACLNLLEDWGIYAIAGNVESNLVAGTDDCGCGFGDGSRCDMFAKLWYNYAGNNVTERNLAYMAGLPDILRFTYAGRSVAVLHGSPRNQSEFVWRSTPAEEKLGFLEALEADVAIGGHCGLPFAHALARRPGRDEGAGSSAERGSGRMFADNNQHRSADESGRYASASADDLDASATDDLFWLNPGVIGMPANDGTPRTWFMTLDDTSGLNFTFHPLHYDHKAAKARMLDDRRLPVSYAATLTTGIWDNTEIMPPPEEAREGIPLDPQTLKAEASIALTTSFAPAAPPGLVDSGTADSRPQDKPKTNLKNLTKMSSYSDPKDLRSFGKIAEWQEEMGGKFFDWYSGVTEGDSALTEREKALIALAVSHAIQCSYCIDAYTTNSLQAGADEEQMMEAVHVAAAVKAGTTLIYARQMQRQVDKVVM